MNEKMRVEFVAAVTEMLGQSPDEIIATDENPQEAEQLIGMLWWAWQTSREAVVVTLPAVPEHESGNSYIEGTLEQCRLAIEAAGLKVAP